MYWQIHTIENDEQWLYYMHIWLVETSKFIMFLRKANFSLLQRNIFYLTTMFVENIEKVPPTQSQININNPANYLSNVMRSI